jgi:hypothetical protein
MRIGSPQIHNREDIIAAFLTGGYRRRMTRNYCVIQDELYTLLQAHFRNISIDRPAQRPQNQKQASDSPSAGLAAYQVGKLDDIERLVSALRVKDAEIRQMAIKWKEAERKLAESWRRWLDWTLERDKVISDLERTIRDLKQQRADHDNCIQQLQEQFAMGATENGGRADRTVLNMSGSLTGEEQEAPFKCTGPGRCLPGDWIVP